MKNERELELIKQRDRYNEMKQLQSIELERQRTELIEARRKARHNKDELQRRKEKKIIKQKEEVDEIRKLQEQRKALELQRRRMSETVIDIELDNDDEMGACGYDKYRNDNKWELVDMTNTERTI
ncbi:hypothetical protein DPMN_125088 [Dreissena polymorpha]|uniref:Uncharacterized protein n=1 Tax=Dreissena polymorpha TaxID=45954 RepID=A0A9D4GXL1_DREPO|nr:hypothetical protein DPMN_125088 [Dreissena polymorpha]